MKSAKTRLLYPLQFNLSAEQALCLVLIHYKYWLTLQNVVHQGSLSLARLTSKFKAIN